MKKSDILHLLADLPEDLDVDALIYTLWFRRKIELALAESDEDEGLSHDEFMREVEQWPA